MVPFQHKDERLKVITYMVTAFIVQAMVLSGLYIFSLNKINKKVISQNYDIVGEVASRNMELAKEIIPSITNKEVKNRELGMELLSNYSYDDNLNYSINPSIGSEMNNYIGYVIVIIILTLLLIIGGFIYFINPLFIEVRYLTYRAENIVENRKIEKERNYKYNGSLDKFVLKFAMMEDRINNSIGLLQEEKINLKNIINDISHQLKTPLMAISMYNEILKDHREMNSEDVDNFIFQSKEQLERMDWLVKTLLKYARLESNVVQYHMEKFSINNTIEESISPLIVKAEEKNQDIIFIAEHEIEFLHDRNWVSEALSNIIKNAIEHTGEKGKIEILLEETPISVRIAIKDNGEGISKEEQKKIFNRFHKGENAINPKSIGIGLCLSKSIIKAHNGDITVESEVGAGSTFYITFLKTVIP